MLTKYTWTVYVCGQLYDIMTNEQVEELIGVWRVGRIDSASGVVEFV